MEAHDRADSETSEPGPSTVFAARRLLKVQYEARCPPRSPQFRWPSNSSMLLAQQYLDHDLFQLPRKHAATPKYQKLMLRELCRKLEWVVEEAVADLRFKGVAEIEYPEVDSALLERYAGLLATGSSTTEYTGYDPVPDHEHTTHYWPTSRDSLPICTMDNVLEGLEHVTVKEEGSAVSKGTTGLKTWEAGLRLAGHLVAHPDLVNSAGTRIVELGAGTGFLGSVCAKLAAGSVTRICLTDVAGQVLTRIRDTISLNQLGDDKHVEVRELNWLELQEERHQSEQRDDLPTIKFLRELKPTLILAADVVYDPDLMEALAVSIRACLEADPRGNAQALIASTIRNPATYETFKAELAAQGLSAQVTPLASPQMVPCQEGIPELSLFPSGHDSQRDGIVELLRIVIANSS